MNFQSMSRNVHHSGTLNISNNYSTAPRNERAVNKNRWPVAVMYSSSFITDSEGEDNASSKMYSVLFEFTFRGQVLSKPR